MAENEERKKIWRIFYSPLSLIVLFLLFLFMARSLWRVYGHEQVSNNDRKQVESELAKTQTRFSTLHDEVEVLETPQGIDEEIRSKFNVSKAGEGVAFVVGSLDTTTGLQASTTQKSWWRQLLNILGL